MSIWIAVPIEILKCWHSPSGFNALQWCKRQHKTKQTWMSCEITETVRFTSCEIISKFLLDLIPNMLNKCWDFYIRGLQKIQVSVKMLTIWCYCHVYWGYVTNEHSSRKDDWKVICFFSAKTSLCFLINFKLTCSEIVFYISYLSVQIWHGRGVYVWLACEEG